MWGSFSCSFSVSGGVGRAIERRCFLCLRLSLRLMGIMGSGSSSVSVSMSVSSGVGVGLFFDMEAAGIVAEGAVGLTTCARVLASDILSC